MECRAARRLAGVEPSADTGPAVLEEPREGSLGSNPFRTGLVPLCPSPSDAIGESEGPGTGKSGTGGKGVEGAGGNPRASTNGTGVPGLIPTGVGGTTDPEEAGTPEEGVAVEAGFGR